MSDIIKLNFPAVEEMAQAFVQGSETLANNVNEVNAIAKMMADGALVGRTGQAFEEACQASLIPSVQRLMEKFQELHQDLLFVMDQMRESDADAARFYN
jgi:WXG100 family type VII secretion target